MSKNLREVEKELIKKNISNRAKLKKKGEIILNSEFDDEMMEDIFFDLKEIIKDKTVDEITLYINSNGGDVDALMPLVDIIDSSPKPVNTIVLGKAYSCGAMLLLSGHKGKRKAYKHSGILIHEVSADFGYNKNSQFKQDAEYLDRINKMLVDMLKSRTKMTASQIYKYMNSNIDIFITADEALKFGIIDKIIK